jgi:hypothetical protein
MSSVVRAWMRFWFEPSTAIDLGVSRLLFFSGVLVMYGTVDFSAWGAVSRSFWMPLPAFAAFRLQPVGPAGLAVLETTWRLALLTSAVGLRTSASTFVAFVLGFYLLGLPHNFGHTFHFDATLVIAMGIMACARAGDAWSVDALLARRRNPPASGDYTWPVRAVWVATALVFLAAGLAKLRYGGLEWIWSSNLSIVLTRAAYHVSDADPITRLGLEIAGHEWLSRTVAAATLIVELGFVLALLSRTARAIMVPAAFAMLIGIRVLMGPTFGGFLIVNVFWVPWEPVLEWLADRVRNRKRSAVSAATDLSTTR